MAKVVIAIGGNALGDTPNDQKEIVKKTAQQLVNFIEKGNEIIIVHGNGPQVGMINNGFDLAHKSENKSPLVDFPECGAMSQGYIGYHLQQAITNELHQRKIPKKVATVVTQTLVDVNDPAFKSPSKPIGSFMSEQEAKQMGQTNGWDVKEDAGRGWRRVIASPKPTDIVEIEMINLLIDNHHVVICAGGGGVPVIEKNDHYHGVAAVIDKDFAAAKVAELTQAESLIILTAVDQVALNYNTPNQKGLAALTLKDAQEYIDQKQFAPGSMLPKVQAAMRFVELTQGKPAFIGSLDKIEEVLSGGTSTKFVL